MVSVIKRGRPPSPLKRQAILQAAIRLLSEKGADASTTREIAERADTTERTLFKHFGSKAGLIQAALDEVSFEFMRVANYARVHDPEPFKAAEFREWHHEFLSGRVRAAEAAPEAYRILFSELLRDPEFRGRYADRWLAGVFKPLERHIKRMQSAGEMVAELPAAVLTATFFNLNLGYLLTRFALMPNSNWHSAGDVAAVVETFARVSRPA